MAIRPTTAHWIISPADASDAAARQAVLVLVLDINSRRVRMTSRDASNEKADSANNGGSIQAKRLGDLSSNGCTFHSIRKTDIVFMVFDTEPI
jgi:hypothetical protein